MPIMSVIAGRREFIAVSCVLLLTGGRLAAEDKPTAKGEVVSLFDGKTLEGWKSTNFGGEGEVLVEEGRIVLEMGNDLTGITTTRDVPKTNYEISLEAMRVEGGDFFCGLTFPVKDKPCSLIVGGWGGTVVGLSSINGSDASDNETTSLKSFKKGQWYKIRVRVTDDKIAAWIDDDQVVDMPLADRELSVRSEVDLSRPLGISSWRTEAALRNIQFRRL